MPHQGYNLHLTVILYNLLFRHPRWILKVWNGEIGSIFTRDLQQSQLYSLWQLPTDGMDLLRCEKDYRSY